jgi:hypothetical protein
MYLLVFSLMGINASTNTAKPVIVVTVERRTATSCVLTLYPFLLPEVSFFSGKDGTTHTSGTAKPCT